MFWRFGGYANISTLDSILDKPDVTLEELLDESDLIQELKQHNTKLVEYLRDEKILRRLLEYVIAPKPEPPAAGSSTSNSEKQQQQQEEEKKPGDEDEDSMAAAPTLLQQRRSEEDREKEEKTRLKYAFVSCEVLSSEAWSIVESLMMNQDHLRMFWKFLERPPPLDPLQASYFTKVNETLLDKKTEEMMAFIKSVDGIVPNILRHVDCPMIMDLLLKIISMEKCEGGAGIVDVGVPCDADSHDGANNIRLDSGYMIKTSSHSCYPSSPTNTQHRHKPPVVISSRRSLPYPPTLHRMSNPALDRTTSLAS